jgi:hypothetical protein
MKKGRHIAPQWELPILEERPRPRLELPPVRSLIRIAGSATDCNGVFKVASAMHLPGGGMFLGLMPPEIKKAPERRPPVKQEELFV